eukprot:3064572-Pyramimonas_sp.AAC.1
MARWMLHHPASLVGAHDALPPDAERVILPDHSPQVLLDDAPASLELDEDDDEMRRGPEDDNDPTPNNQAHDDASLQSGVPPPLAEGLA